MPEEQRINNNEGITENVNTTENLTVTGAPLALNILRNYEAIHQIEPLMDQAMSSPDSPATAYMTKCYVCGEEITADCYANLRYICPHCRDAVKWLKNHISMLEIMLNKEWR